MSQMNGVGSIIAPIGVAFIVGVGFTFGTPIGTETWSEDMLREWRLVLWALRNGFWLFPLVTGGIIAAVLFGPR